MDANIYTVMMTAITTLGGAAAWRFYEKRAAKKEENENFIKNDCRTRIAKLEALLERSSEEKDEMRATILELTRQVAQLQTQVQFLTNGKGKGL